MTACLKNYLAKNPAEGAKSLTILYVQVNVYSENLRINNQLDASNIQSLFLHKTLHVSDISCAHHQELSAVHSVIGTFRAGYVTAS